MIKQELNELVDQETVDLIERYTEIGGFDDLVWVPGKRLHEFMVGGGLWFHEYGYALYGRKVEIPDGEHSASPPNFFYYMGAENEAQVVIKLADELAVYEGISEERIERWFYDTED